ncbi:vascular endothelial growth factor C-like [Branchiostoma lanceolatum]|uniref:vascular endothelial growth factor C-like n=1 Tax=Branchiostoma lanceolatum TaxID=7740 RepID=UPI003454011B
MACFYGKLNQAQLGDSAMSVYSLFVLMSLLGKPFGYSHFDTRSRLDRHLAGVGSTEDLIRLYYPQEWRKIMCHMRGGGERYLTDYQSDYSEDGSGMGRSAAAATMDLMGIVNKVDEEWEKAFCKPRETPVDAATELQAPTDVTYRPSCVSVFRCGGCCNDEMYECVASEKNMVSKTIFEVGLRGPNPVTKPFENHTRCECRAKMGASASFLYQRGNYKRAVSAHVNTRCYAPNKTCGPYEKWDDRDCACVSALTVIGDDDHCGPLKEWREDECACVCKRPCPRRFIEDLQTCECRCPPYYQTRCQRIGQRLHWGTCKCVPKICHYVMACPRGTVYSEDVCACVMLAGG